jgi:hypothetical protein
MDGCWDPCHWAIISLALIRTLRPTSLAFAKKLLLSRTCTESKGDEIEEIKHGWPGLLCAMCVCVCVRLCVNNDHPPTQPYLDAASSSRGAF